MKNYNIRQTSSKGSTRTSRKKPTNESSKVLNDWRKPSIILVHWPPKKFKKLKSKPFFYGRIQIENLKRTVEILKGKYNEDHYEEEIEELMSPIRNIQEELHQKIKESNLLR